MEEREPLPVVIKELVLGVVPVVVILATLRMILAGASQRPRPTPARSARLRCCC